MIININENSMYFIRRPPTKILSLESYIGEFIISLVLTGLCIFLVRNTPEVKILNLMTSNKVDV